MRPNTERPIIVEQGTNVLVPRNTAVVVAQVDEILATGGKRGRMPAHWGGCTAQRIAGHLASWLGGRRQTGAEEVRR